MKYLLDTDVIIDHLRGKKPLDQNIIRKGAAISVITYGEILYGAFKSPKKEDNLNKINILIGQSPISIINITQEIIRLFAEVKSSLETKGQRLDDFDILIGSTAVTNSLCLHTENISHFQRIPGLKLTA